MRWTLSPIFIVGQTPKGKGQLACMMWCWIVDIEVDVDVEAFRETYTSELDVSLQ